TDELKDHVEIIGPDDHKKRSGIFNMCVDKLDSKKIMKRLKKNNIIARPKRHCTYSWYHSHSVKGGIRFSFYLYNTVEEVKRVCDILKEEIKK
ncbi:MAG: aminotransferase class V-fold PLP-dependent enzyme, partial [Thermoplasmatota archaeon]